MKRRYYSTRNWSPLRKATRFSLSNEVTTKQKQMWMFKRTWIYTKGKLCLNSRKYYFLNQSSLLLWPNMRKACMYFNKLLWLCMLLSMKSQFQSYGTVLFLRLRSIITFVFLFLMKKTIQWFNLQEYSFPKT